MQNKAADRLSNQAKIYGPTYRPGRQAYMEWCLQRDMRLIGEALGELDKNAKGKIGEALLKLGKDAKEKIGEVLRGFDKNTKGEIGEILGELDKNVEGKQELLFEATLGPSPSSLEQSVIHVSSQWNQIIRELSRRPQDLLRMGPRLFEELVAELLERDGLEVQLTPRTRDGGRDILAFNHGLTGQHLYLVECKRYAQTNPIGVELVRSLYGVVEHEKATAGMLVTTSRFTHDALKFVDPIKYRMSLREFNDIKKWLLKYRDR